MINLLIPIKYYALGPEHRPEYFEGRQLEKAILTLTTIPPITYDVKAGKTNIGRWMSPSLYLGKRLFGVFYVTRIEPLDRPDYRPYVDDRRVKNPVGLFFDSDSVTPDASPFLTLYGFAPIEMRTVSGFGMLGMNRTDGVDPDVDWSRI